MLSLSEYAYIKELATDIQQDIKTGDKAFQENPGLRAFETLLKSMPLEKYGHKKYANLILFSLLEKKVASLPKHHPDTEKMQQKLHHTLIENLQLQSLPKSPL